MKIGLLGGTFDPVHNGHIRLAKAALSACNLDEVWLLPAGHPYFKEGQGVSSPEKRAKLIRLAIEKEADLRLCEIELHRPGRTYTWETLAQLREERPADEFFFILGADCLFDLPDWKYPERILENAALIAACRGGAKLPELKEQADRLIRRFGGEIILLPLPELPLSSTLIREKIAAGESIRGLVPEAVEQALKGEKQMKKILIVIDMQKDFIDGSLGTQEAQAIVPAAAEKIRGFDGELLWTLDTHEADYLSTQEGKNLPVPHCIRGTAGHAVSPALEALRDPAKTFEKHGFGSPELAAYLRRHIPQGEEGEWEAELIGLCTDICVITNALLIKAALPELPLFVDASCCAGVTPEAHRAALSVMRSCQIGIRNEEKR